MCDVDAYWGEASYALRGNFSSISLDPYSLPFESNSFDAVVSTSVLEHAQNKEECFREIH